MIEIRPLAHCDAMVTIPGSKSYTHRALIVSALADGESVLINALQSEDTGYTIQGLEKLGVQVFWKGDLLHVLGKGGKLKSGEERIFVGNSGTSMRFLTALAALLTPNLGGASFEALRLYNDWRAATALFRIGSGTQGSQTFQ